MADICVIMDLKTKNGQTYSNNLSAVADELFECVLPFCENRYFFLRPIITYLSDIYDSHNRYSWRSYTYLNGTRKRITIKTQMTREVKLGKNYSFKNCTNSTTWDNLYLPNISFVHNVDTLKILRFSHHKIFKVGLAIFQRYTWKVYAVYSLYIVLLPWDVFRSLSNICDGAFLCNNW